MHKDAEVNKSLQKYRTFNKTYAKINKKNAKNVKVHNRTKKNPLHKHTLEYKKIHQTYI